MRWAKVAGWVISLAATGLCQNYGAWTKSGTITLGTTPEWADFTGSVTDFPVLVRLDSSTFAFSEAKAGGADLRFSSADGSKALPYEVETWDAAKGTATVWVKVPSIAGNALQTFKMYWGNPAAASESNGAAVFPPASGYIGVWHLSEAGTVNKDATGNGNDGTKIDDDTKATDAANIAQAATPLGLGQGYNLTKSFAQTEVPAGKVNLKNKSLTVSAWIKRRALNGTGDYFIAQGTQDPNVGLRLGFDYRNQFTFCFGGGLSDTKDPFTKPIKDTVWHFWAGTFNLDTKKMSIFQDGMLDTSATVPAAFTGTGALDFGWAYGPSGEYYHPSGLLDEVRISGNVASADWIKLSYLNQAAGQKLVSAPVPAACVEDFAVASASVKVDEGAPAVLSGTAKCAQRYQWVLVDGTQEIPQAAEGTRLRLSTRVNGTTSRTYRFKAMYAGTWKSKDVSVNITEKIPEPIFELNLPSTFYGVDPGVGIDLYPSISNLAAIKASAAPDLHFDWEITGVNHFISMKGDTLSVFFLEDGPATVKLCLDNGGEPVCKIAKVTATTGLAGRSVARGRQAVAMRGRTLIWDRDATLEVWDLSGKLLFARAGKRGDRLELSAEAAGRLLGRGHIVKVAPQAEGDLPGGRGNVAGGK